MAIHMDKDPTQGGGGNNRRREGGGGSGGGLGSLMKFLPIVLFFFFKRPKLTVIVLLVLGGFYYFSGGNLGSLLGGDETVNNSEYGVGGVLDDAQYDKAMVFEPLVAGSRNQMPTKVSLREYAPTRQNQGRQGSCVGWSSAYAARTILHARATGQNPDDIVFSPSFLYNQIALEGCQGAYINDAMENMKKNGGLPLSKFPYNERTCSNEPDRTDIGNGQAFRIKGYNRLSMNHDKYKVNSLAVKQNLAQGAPVVIGMMVGGTFMNGMRGKDVWNPTSTDKRMNSFGGHAMCVIGYDDNKAGGAFEIMNSWGEGWGERGFCWVRYGDFDHFVREAYGLYPMGNAKDQVKPENFKVNFGLVNNANQKLIPLRKVNGKTNVFRSTQPLPSGSRFKVLVANNMECYIYIFNEEANGESNVLFPYTAKHSPYCGITGTRIFPKDYSLKSDDVGSRDRIAILVSKKEIDYDAVAQLINQNRQSEFVDKVNSALSSILDSKVSFTAGESVSFQGGMTDDKAVAMIIEVDK